ncbi:uncharacterized protein GGS25DRAFT_481405 [Hypoxylon fragiforme]|uniref:uncharacterized protein n=1 Tax=Hypoxylon fragiforme TaxID=63214 RepID=UPI0020C6DAC2|nr:uncharacterized protein GGS25DRAFT_481405 [Hypoxylon fragiforme]KAI2611102.1 hypothetical protein GGS25DRAFT_481405 [Hypoxylon fragiforme]
MPKKPSPIPFSLPFNSEDSRAESLYPIHKVLVRRTVFLALVVLSLTGFLTMHRSDVSAFPLHPTTHLFGICGRRATVLIMTGVLVARI